MTEDNVIELPRKTDATTKGPYLEYAENEVVVDYDTEQLDGSLEWTRLVFHDVLAAEFLNGACCRPGEVEAYNVMQCLMDSEWRHAHIQRWERRVGCDDIQKELGGSDRFRHYRVFFDDTGVINVLAEQVEIDAEPELKENAPS